MVALGLCALSFAGLLWLPGRSWARLPAALAPMLALLAMRLGSWGQLPFAASLLLVVALLPIGRGHAGARRPVPLPLMRYRRGRRRS